MVLMDSGILVPAQPETSYSRQPAIPPAEVRAASLSHLLATSILEIEY